jgi:hypothetical protein
MNLSEEFKLYETMWDNIKLNEKWETFDSDYGPAKIWHSTSASEFRSFLRNAPSMGIKGLRLIIGDGIYLAARASDFNHENIVDIATDNYLIDNNDKLEWLTCGFPKCSDFDEDNFECNGSSEMDPDFSAEWDAQVEAEYAAVKGQKYTVIDPETGEAKEFVRDGKRHILIADCGTFEVELYNFYSKEFLAYKNGDGGRKTNFQLFETSNTYFALKPLIKKLYMTNL